jgi:hypothetical protein
MKTAWYDNKILPEAMLKSNFLPLEQSEHFQSLLSCFNYLKNEKTLLDLGCGAADISKIFQQYEYTGADLGHIIENVSQVKYPDNKYISFDVEKDSLDFLTNYDIILMNGFISELPNWYFSLTKVCCSSNKYIILHRQDVTESTSEKIKYKTYGDLFTLNNIINYKDLLKIFFMNGFELIHETNSFPNNEQKKTFLFKKCDE